MDTKPRSDNQPRIQDVAREAEVSIATVSRVLNGAMVREPLKARVLAAVEQLAYVPNGPARALASRRARSLGAIVPTVDNAIFAKSIKALQDRLFDSGYTLLLASSDYSREREYREIQALLGHGVDGLVLVGSDHEPRVFELIRSKRVPYVCLWCADPSSAHPCIGFDNAGASRRLAEHVLSLGHGTVAMIAGITDGNDRALARVQGVRSALRAAGLDFAPGHLLESRYALADGRVAAARLLASAPRPSVIMCGNDVLAIGAVLECQARGLRVPGDVSVTGFDDQDLAAQLQPAMTTVTIPAAEMGRRAADYLLARLAGEDVTCCTVLETRLALRDTTAAPASTRLDYAAQARLHPGRQGR